MSIKIISIGKKHESWISEGIERFEKRLIKPFDVNWVILPSSSRDGLSARQEESQRMINVLDDACVVLLDERGKNITSPALSEIIQDKFVHSKDIVFVIGGAFGVDEEMHKRADFIWSLSNLVLPHQLVRLVLIEQIYRAQEIAKNSGYHHE